MRLDLRFHGHLDDGRQCSATMSVYVQDEKDQEKIIKEAATTAPWLIHEPGWPDIPEDATVNIDRVENLNEQRARSHAKMIAPGVFAGSGPPGPLAAFLKKMGVGELMFPPGMFPEPDPEPNDGP